MHDHQFVPASPRTRPVCFPVPAGLFRRLPGQACLFSRLRVQASLPLLLQASLPLLLEACLFPRLSFHACPLLRVRLGVRPFPCCVQACLFSGHVTLQPLDLPLHPLLFARQFSRHPMGVVPRPGQVRQHPRFLVAVRAFQNMPSRLGCHTAPIVGAARRGVIPLPLLLSAQLIPSCPEFVPARLQLLQAASPLLHRVLRHSQFRDVTFTVVRRPGLPPLGLPMCIEPVHRVREYRVFPLGPLQPRLETPRPRPLLQPLRERPPSSLQLPQLIPNPQLSTQLDNRQVRRTRIGQVPTFTESCPNPRSVAGVCQRLSPPELPVRDGAHRARQPFPESAGRIDQTPGQSRHTARYRHESLTNRPLPLGTR
jgi:hypothetical protein